MKPRVSAVVPVFNVEQYLRPCLDSLLSQTLSGVEIIVIDDGATDGSGLIADAYADTHDNVRVFHVDNGGLGRARNIGMDQAAGEFLAFVDSDDVVPPSAYEAMYRTVQETGSDFVAGQVMRYDGARVWPSRLHETAIPETVLRTHIAAMPSLLYDTAAWNKLFRRTFWDHHSFSFPEHVFWEDIPVMIPAHFLATAVDVLHEPVYWWRERQDGSQSITQRRGELKNLEDRMAAIQSVNHLLLERASADFKARQDRKALTIDVQFYLEALPDADETYQRRFMELVGDYLRTTDESVLRSLSPPNRVKYHLVRDGDLARLLDVLAQERNGRAVEIGKRRLKLHAQVPLDGPKLPKAVLDLSRSAPMRAGVDVVRWEAGKLVIEGYGYIEGAGLPTPVSAVRRLRLRETTGPRTVSVWPAPRRRVDVTASVRSPDHSYTWSGFRAVVDPAALAPLPEADETVWEVVLQISTPWGRRGTRLGPPRTGAARFPAHALVGSGLTVVPHYLEGRWLALAARNDAVVAETVDANGTTLTISGFLRPGHPALAGGQLVVKSQGGVDRATAPIGAGPARPDGTVPFSAILTCEPLVAGHRAVSEVAWDVVVADRASAATTPVTLSPGQPEVGLAVGNRELVVRTDGEARLRILDRAPAAVVQLAGFGSDGALHLSGRLLAGGAEARVQLRHGVHGRHEFPVTRETDRFAVRLPVYGVPTFAGERPLPPGTWELWSLLRWPDGSSSEQPVTFEATSLPALERVRLDAFTRMALRGSPAARLVLTVERAPDSERGGRHQRRLRSVEYRLDRRLHRLEDLVLFESWRGKQYSDSPRAISEELRRREKGPRQVWVVENETIAVPAGVSVVRRWSPSYYAALATARWVISNDSMPTFFVKRRGMVYAQTWHGTPLKRIAFDMEKVQFRNKRYLEEFGLEVAKWDYLLSPNRFSTDIMRRAFRYDGNILETGYPRNDVLYAADRDERAADVRRRLGIAPDQRVVLYAPTWRDDMHDRAGRYRLPIMFDVGAMAAALGDNHVLLFRGHYLTAGRTGADEGGFLRNVTFWPDIAELYLVADVLVTDYSSVMFDFANTRRPMLFFTWDLDRYRDTLRGFYFDFEAEAPGPLLREGDELIAAIKDVDSIGAAYAERYDRFVEKFCPLDDGRASARVVDALFARR